MSGSKQPFRFIRKWNKTYVWPSGKPEVVTYCEYEASVWQGPLEAGEAGRYVRTKVRDIVLGNGRFLRTSPGVSYFADLCRAVAK